MSGAAHRGSGDGESRGNGAAGSDAPPAPSNEPAGTVGRRAFGRPPSLVRRLTAIGAIAVVVVAAVGGGLAVLHHVSTVRNVVRERTEMAANLLCELSSGPLAFRDRDEALAALSSLSHARDVLDATIFDAEGAVFASWSSSASPSEEPPALVPAQPAPDTHVAGQVLAVLRPVAHRGERYGTLRIRASTASIEAYVQGYIVTVAALALCLVGLALLLAGRMQRRLIRPLLDLVRLAGLARKGETTERVVPRGAAEIADLCVGMNEMLDGLEERAREREAAAAAERQLANRLRTLHAIDQGSLQGQHPAQIAETALAGLEAVIPFELGVVLEHPCEDAGPCEDGGLLRPLGARATFGAAPALPDDLRIPRASCQHSPTEELGLEDVPEELAAPLRAAGLRRVYCVPLAHAGEKLGVLVIARSTDCALPSMAVEAATEVAEHLALCLHHARLAAAVERHTRELEERVEERTAQLTQSYRELESFSYTVSHDLRAPLRTMEGFAAVLLEDKAHLLDEEGKGLLRELIQGSRRMDHLIRDLLAYGRLARVEVAIESISLDDIVAEAASLLRADIAAKAASVRVEEPLGHVLASRVLLSQAVTNVLSNAVKFVPPDREPVVRISAEKRGRRLRLAVADNGIGIEPRYQESVFGMFERLHSASEFEGTGIGLAIVKKAVERMGGAVGLTSVPGVGTTIFIELPRSSTPRRTGGGTAGGGGT